MDYTKLPSKRIRKYNKLQNASKPEISIITPYYNAGESIKETYDCITNQTYPFFEWIIVNDGSTDKKSCKIIEDLSKTDPRIKYFQKENGGPSIARDYGISKANKNTKYIFFIDADDQMEQTMLECLYWSLETHPDASFAYAAMVNFGDKEFLWEKYLTIEQEKEENLINIASMVRKKDLLEVGCFGIKEKAMYEDWNLWLKLIRAGKKPLRISAPLFWYRFTSNGEFSRANKNKDKAMKYVNETAHTIANDIVEPIQFPRYGDDYATCNEHNLTLPDYQKDNKKTILYIFPWMVVGGADLFNLELIKRLPQDKYNAIILTTTPSRNPLRQSFEDYAEIYDMSSFLDRIDYQSFTEYIISSRKVDLVFISNTEYGYYMTPYLKTKYPNIPFIDYIHSIDFRDPRKSFGRCTRDVNRYLSRTYCCNNFTKKQLQESFDKKDIDTIYIGTDEEKYNPKKYDKNSLLNKYGIPQNKKIISFVARLSEEKRPLMFVDIAKEIKKQNPDTYFVIAGDGPLMSKVKSKIDSNFRLLGMIDKTDEVYAFSDITINCSSLEGLALTSYESLAMSTPVISTDVGGQTELIDDSVGGIVHYNANATELEYKHEVSEYASQTTRVLADISNISKNCRKKILEKFTLNIMAKQFDDIFNNAIINDKKSVIPKKNNNADNTIYELACENFNTSYYNYTNYYYEHNLGVYLTANRGKYQRLYRHIRNKLEVFDAVNQGKDIIEYIRSLKVLLHELKLNAVKLVKAFISFIVLIAKIIKRIIKKIIHNNNC